MPDRVPSNAIEHPIADGMGLNSGKIVSAEEAVKIIQNGDTVATGGFVGIGFAEEIAIVLEAGESLGNARFGASHL